MYIGAESLGLPATAHGLFPGGGPDLITYFYRKCNADLREQMTEQKEAEAEGRVESVTIMFCFIVFSVHSTPKSLPAAVVEDRSSDGL